MSTVFRPLVKGRYARNSRKVDHLHLQNTSMLHTCGLREEVLRWSHISSHCRW
ncbi:hypothetical protein BDY19DRAFT_949139 [Irpex rosettiformis]|uniref:Uncharacterized protein n=1 Tax=Irpex rosettiformis TaxID=378272 RepID=A0ACB8U364_9APHY|nr:hypothetical protein BDY19DRAFT_949139 [Irpex rosettiformis]